MRITIIELVRAGVVDAQGNPSVRPEVLGQAYAPLLLPGMDLFIPTEAHRPGQSEVEGAAFKVVSIQGGANILEPPQNLCGYGCQNYGEPTSVRAVVVRAKTPPMRLYFWGGSWNPEPEPESIRRMREPANGPSWFPAMTIPMAPPTPAPLQSARNDEPQVENEEEPVPVPDNVLQFPSNRRPRRPLPFRGSTTDDDGPGAA